MTRHRLDNSRWGFESNCFVCEESNLSGLRIPFFHDDESAEVVADFALGPAFSGAPNYVHGGLLLAIMDEAMAWAAIALGGVMALTRQTSTTFLRPVRVEYPHRVVAALDARPDDWAEPRPDAGLLAISAHIVPQGGLPADACARAAASFVPLSPGPAREALGRAAAGADAGYVRG